MKNERDKTNKTELLYETDGNITEFDAVIIEAGECEDKKGYYAILDRTAFFPGGGGQQPDTGTICLQNGDKIRVIDVSTPDGSVRHITDTAVNTGEAVKCFVDADKRSCRMQIHGAEHLISGLIHNKFGYDNKGFHMTDDLAIFDVSGPLTREEILDIESRA